DEDGVIAALAEYASAEMRMVGLTGGVFRMGSEDSLAYPEDGEGPVREVDIAPFAIAPSGCSHDAPATCRHHGVAATAGEVSRASASRRQGAQTQRLTASAPVRCT
ncbi:formylglycine-generating enzyme family protein, partial [Burkholderia multivorans]|uniref:formylglycine-generating enzyme family protein n=1 Tax=Burkholderia multivorans TaxID=87883 RepID=UPI001C657161